MEFKKVKITESHQELKFLAGGRAFKAEVFGTGLGCTVEIDEMDPETGMMEGRRKSYRIPGRIKWSVIVARYTQDVTPHCTKL